MSQFLILWQGHNLRRDLIQFHPWKWQSCQETQRVFQQRKDSKRPPCLIIKVCGSLSAKSCHAKGNKQSLRIRSQLRGQQANFCNLLDVSTTILCWVTGSVPQQQCARLPQLVINKRFLEEIFTSWCLIMKIEKISALRKFPATRNKYQIATSSIYHSDNIKR